MCLRATCGKVCNMLLAPSLHPTSPLCKLKLIYMMQIDAAIHAKMTASLDTLQAARSRVMVSRASQHALLSLKLYRTRSIACWAQYVHNCQSQSTYTSSTAHASSHSTWYSSVSCMPAPQGLTSCAFPSKRLWPAWTSSAECPAENFLELFCQPLCGTGVEV